MTKREAMLLSVTGYSAMALSYFQYCTRRYISASKNAYASSLNQTNSRIVGQSLIKIFLPSQSCPDRSFGNANHQFKLTAMLENVRPKGP